MAKDLDKSTNSPSMDNLLNSFTQFALPGLTIGGQLAIALKFPAFGLILSLSAQPFWLYSGWKSHNKAGQTGILITSVIMTLVTAFGVINYWFLR